MKDKELAKKDIMSVFTEAMAKYELRCNKEGNTVAPWDDFSEEHLIKRLDEEYTEWKQSGDTRELIDVINLAAFVRLARIFNSTRKTGDQK